MPSAAGLLVLSRARTRMASQKKVVGGKGVQLDVKLAMKNNYTTESFGDMERDSRDLGQCVAECASRGGDTKD